MIYTWWLIVQSKRPHVQHKMVTKSLPVSGCEFKGIPCFPESQILWMEFQILWKISVQFNVVHIEKFTGGILKGLFL